MKDRPIGRTVSESLRSSGARLPVFTWSGRRLLAAAALLHVGLAVGLFWAGRAQVAPRLLDRDAIMEPLAFDSYEYRRGAVRLAGMLKDDGLGAWAAAPAPAHVKLISIQFALLGPLFGYGPLSAEPLNLFCYLSILSLVLLLGREVGGRRVGLLAAGAVALWPTLLLHTTQLLKDPLFIAGALALVLVVTTWLTRTYSPVDALVMVALAALAAGVLLLIRSKFVVVVFAVVCFGLALLVVRQLLERRLLYWNLACPLLILLGGALTHFNLTDGGQKFKRYPSGGDGQHKSVVGPGKNVPAVISYTRPLSPETKTPPTFARRLYTWAEIDTRRISSTRNRFNVVSPESGSAIDRGVEFNNLRDPLLYLPRAFAIGFWAPFPDQWVGGGKRVGSAGRLLSGAETFVMYLCELLALLAVWRAPRCLPAWLLLLTATFGVTMLGLIVSNVGTLYRFRYPFWILLIILGAKGFEGAVKALRAGASGPLGRGGRLKEAAQV